MVEVLNCESSMSDIAEKNEKIKQNLRRLYDEIDDIALTELMSERYTIITTPQVLIFLLHQIVYGCNMFFIFPQSR